MSNRRYDPDFKLEAVRMVVEEGLGVREVERSLGFTFGVLKGWVQKHRDHQDTAFAVRNNLAVPKMLGMYWAQHKKG